MKTHPGLVQRCLLQEAFLDLTLSPKRQLKDSTMTISRALREVEGPHPSLAFQAGTQDIPVVKSITIPYKDLTTEVFKRRVAMSQRIMKLRFSSPPGTTSIILVPPPPPPSPAEGYGSP